MELLGDKSMDAQTIFTIENLAYDNSWAIQELPDGMGYILHPDADIITEFLEFLQTK